MFWRSILPPSSGLRVSQPRNQYEAGSKMLGLFFDPEDGGDIFLQNVGLFALHYTAFYPRW
jgi:hypothetical protein